MTEAGRIPAARSDDLAVAVRALRDALRHASFPLDLPGTAANAREHRATVDQLDDYLIPRLQALDAPLLAVVGGSTGAGKSTLVNSVVGSVVSRAGVRRPTTHAPVLIHHPDDLRWFDGDRILPGLARRTGAEPAGDADPMTVRLVAGTSLPAGLAILDAPDIDSVVARNRDLATQLLAAADLWIFLTTAARYADAVPWSLLHQAAARGTVVAIVLDRVPTGAGAEITAHLREMLAEQGLGDAPLFEIAETTLDSDGLLPESERAPLRDWLEGLAGDAAARADVVRRTLTGALDALDARSAEIADALADQARAATALRAISDRAYAVAGEEIARGASDGTLLRGEVLARWQEFVGTGELYNQIEATVSRVRDRVVRFIRGRPDTAEPLGEALQTGVAALIAAHAEAAADTAADGWRQSPGGAPLIERRPQLAHSSPDLERRAERLVRDWQAAIFEMVQTEGRGKRATARGLAYGVNGVTLALMLVTFASTGGLTGAEAGIAGGGAVLAQKLLEAIFGDEAVRRLAARARADLAERCDALLAEERARFDGELEAAAACTDAGHAIAAARTAVGSAR